MVVTILEIALSSITYLSVISHDSICLAFLIAALNGVNILCDLKNTYLNAECHEKIWFEGRLECGEDAGKVCVVIRALYGLKSVDMSWKVELAGVLRDLLHIYEG